MPSFASALETTLHKALEAASSPEHPDATKRPRRTPARNRLAGRLRTERLQHRKAPRRDAVADLEGLGEAELLELADVPLELRGRPAQLLGQLGCPALRVGVHAFGFVGDTDQEAIDATFPGYVRLVSTIGRERGWSPPSRAQYEAACAPGGAYLIGGPDAVVAKAHHVDEALGGIDRLTFQMTNVLLPHPRMRRSIELLGTEVAPRIRADVTAARP